MGTGNERRPFKAEGGSELAGSKAEQLIKSLRSRAIEEGTSPDPELQALLKAAATELDRLLARTTWRGLDSKPAKGSDFLTKDEHGNIQNGRKIHQGYWQDGEWVPGVVAWLPAPGIGKPRSRRSQR